MRSDAPLGTPIAQIFEGCRCRATVTASPPATPSYHRMFFLVRRGPIRRRVLHSERGQGLLYPGFDRLVLVVFTKIPDIDGVPLNRPHGLQFPRRDVNLHFFQRANSRLPLVRPKQALTEPVFHFLGVGLHLLICHQIGDFILCANIFLVLAQLLNEKRRSDLGKWLLLFLPPIR